MRARRSTKGFTLLELLVVVAIIAVLATLILGGLASARRRTQIAVARSNIAAIKAALSMYETETGRYPCRAGHSVANGANLFQNDITYAWAALHNRRTLQYGGGPGSPYIEWKPEQVARVNVGQISPHDFGKDADPEMGGSATMQLIFKGAGQLLDPGEFDQVNANDATFFSSQWNSLRPDTGSAALAFADPWGNPYVYVEWASVPQTTKDNATVQFQTGGGTGSGSVTVTLRPHDPSKFDIYSFGPNGVNEGGDGDDVASWSSVSKK
jgi:prepilin-type N-terminal cleavage/methylation domain-containing protein